MRKLARLTWELDIISELVRCRGQTLQYVQLAGLLAQLHRLVRFVGEIDGLQLAWVRVPAHPGALSLQGVEQSLSPHGGLVGFLLACPVLGVLQGVHHRDAAVRPGVHLLVRVGPRPQGGRGQHLIRRLRRVRST